MAVSSWYSMDGVRIPYRERLALRRMSNSTTTEPLLTRCTSIRAVGMARAVLTAAMKEVTKLRRRGDPSVPTVLKAGTTRRRRVESGFGAFEGRLDQGEALVQMENGPNGRRWRRWWHRATDTTSTRTDDDRVRMAIRP